MQYNSQVNQLFQADPPYVRRSPHQLGTWTDTIVGYLHEASRLSTCLFHNHKHLGKAYRYHAVINIHDVLTAKAHQDLWPKVSRTLRRRGLNAFWLREISLHNTLHYHLIICDDLPEEKVSAILRDAMPSQDVLRWHHRVQPITDVFSCCKYIVKAKLAGKRNGKHVKDVWANKRVLFARNTGLSKYGEINRFWEKPVAEIWSHYQAKEQRISEGLMKAGTSAKVEALYALVDQDCTLEQVRRGIGYSEG